MILQPINNPDKARQYQLALKLILSGVSPQLPTEKRSDNNINDWLCVSVWRIAIYGTGDDRLRSGESSILRDLASWEQWLENYAAKSHAGSQVHMISVPLIESTVELKATAFADIKLDQKFKRVEIAVRNFENFQKEVDAVSLDMSATHMLWVYEKGIPKYTAIHQGQNSDAFALQAELHKIIAAPETSLIT